MALSIKTGEADRLARALAAETGESLTEAVTEALRQRLERVRTQRTDLMFGVGQLILDYRSALADDRPEDEILGYDEHGLPT